MRYFLDTEFDGINGDTLSLALASETGRGIYLIAHDVIIRDPYVRDVVIRDPWVHEYVFKVMHSVPVGIETGTTREYLGMKIREFLKDDKDVEIIWDSPEEASKAYQEASDELYRPGSVYVTVRSKGKLITR
jgi:hypothetical protein